MKHRIAVQVLNGATGEIREVVAKVTAADEQEAVNKIFALARTDDYYYRFLGMSGVVSPTIDGAVEVPYQAKTYWALEV